MEKDFLHFIEREKLFSAEQNILLAVSGGPDSAVMAELFFRHKFKFAIAHCNFLLRGKESDDDEQFCENLAKKYKVTFLVEHFETGKHAVNNKISIQMAARQLRYDWLNECVKKHKFDFIATAHQKNDVLETMLINFTRGTGLKGLHGILPKQGNIIRPMLFATREEIESFANMQQIAFRYDRSNASEKYVRNKIRIRVIPILKEINPSIEQTAIGVSKNLYASEQILEHHLEEERNRCTEIKGKKLYISIKKLKTLKPLKAYLFEFLREMGFNARVTEQIADSLNETSGKKFLSDTHQLIKDREYLIVSEIKEDDFPEIEITKTSKRVLNPVKISFDQKKVNKKFVIPPGRNIACVDYSKLKFPLVLRKWSFGDRFIPFGMSGRQKVSDFLVNNKIDVGTKSDIWVLTNKHGEIIWLIGHRIDDRYKITPETKKAYVAELL